MYVYIYVCLFWLDSSLFQVLFIQLNDTERNSAYDKAICGAISEFRSVHGRAPVVLDIGAGSGLLAMFAARGGAEKVFDVFQWV